MFEKQRIAANDENGDWPGMHIAKIIGRLEDMAETASSFSAFIDNDDSRALCNRYTEYYCERHGQSPHVDHVKGYVNLARSVYERKHPDVRVTVMVR